MGDLLLPYWEGQQMRPGVWQPPLALSAAEQAVVRRIRRARLFVFLRERRHELFDEAFQGELGTLYRESRKGHPPAPPAQLALATLLQAYTGASDDEAIEAMVMDRRWQLVLGCLDAPEPPFSKGTLVAFRRRLIAKELDRRLVERTVELAERRGGFGPRALRAALDSSPLWGAGRVEDSYNLMGHALRKALGVLARQQGRGLAAVAGEAGAELLTGSSLKAALDLDWDDAAQRQAALERVLATLERAQRYLDAQEQRPPAAVAALATAQTVRDQDVESDDGSRPRLRRGVARERRISVEDPEMRHGRKSQAQRVDGYKRHVLRDLDSGVLRAVGVTPANAPEATVTADLQADLDQQRPAGAALAELHIDRAYLTSDWVRQRPPERQIFCKAWPVYNGERFAKTAFTLDWSRQVLRCPNQQELAFHPGGTVRFPAATCAACPLRERCTTSAHGRSVHVHPDERLLQELRHRQLSPAGRAKLRERAAVEHSLAHLGRWQGRRCRYRGQRKVLFDTRRCAAVHNLHVAMRYHAVTGD
jgi:transposase